MYMLLSRQKMQTRMAKEQISVVWILRATSKIVSACGDVYKRQPWGSEAAEQGAAEQGATEESVAAEALALEVKSLKWENNILSTWIYQTGI